MDALDSKALRLLIENGRISWAELAQQLGLSAPAVADRVRKLEERGVLLGYHASVNPASIPLGIQAFVAVTLGKTKHRKQFLKAIQRCPEVLECHHVAGEEDFLLKVIARDTAHLDHLIGETIREIAGVLRTKTTVVLSTTKDSTVLPPELVPTPDLGPSGDPAQT